MVSVTGGGNVNEIEIRVAGVTRELKTEGFGCSCGSEVATLKIILHFGPVTGLRAARPHETSAIKPT